MTANSPYITLHTRTHLRKASTRLPIWPSAKIDTGVFIYITTTVHGKAWEGTVTRERFPILRQFLLNLFFRAILFLSFFVSVMAAVCYQNSTVELKDFEIGQCIGKGQFSSVYRARCKLDQQMVALKKVQLYEMTDVKARYCTFPCPLIVLLDYQLFCN